MDIIISVIRQISRSIELNFGLVEQLSNLCDLICIFFENLKQSFKSSSLSLEGRVSLGAIPVRPLISVDQLEESFEEFEFDYSFHGGGKKNIKIGNTEHLDEFFEEKIKEINEKHKILKISFVNCSKLKQSRNFNFTKKYLLNKRYDLEFSDDLIFIKPKTLVVEQRGTKKISSFENGIREEFSFENDSISGERIYPENWKLKKEVGIFSSLNYALISGYKIKRNGEVNFISPKVLASYYDGSGAVEYQISIFEDQLVVLDHDMEFRWGDVSKGFIISTESLENIFFKVISKEPMRANFLEILNHPSFPDRKSFIDRLLSKNEAGIYHLFIINEKAASDVLSLVSSEIEFDPLNVVNEESQKNFFCQAAYLRKELLLNTLIKCYPEKFVSCGQDVIRELLIQGHPGMLVKRIAKDYVDYGGLFDLFHRLWIEVSQAEELEKTFFDAFDDLLPDEKQTLYRAAFVYHNPYLFEKCDRIISGNEYAINLMWINNNKLPAEQEYLWADSTDLTEKFTKAVSDWAILNEDAAINFWYDGSMAHSYAVERTKEVIENLARGKKHGFIRFRDIRNIELVCENERLFREDIPIYFRVDLLRAAAADYILRRKEAQFFVYGDLDMTPIGSCQIFDKRTVDYLNDYGFVMAKQGFAGFENGFQILNGSHELLMEAHSKVILHSTIRSARLFPGNIIEQQIYETYGIMFIYFLWKDGRFGKFDREEEAVRDLYGDFFQYDQFGRVLDRLPFEHKPSLKKIMPSKPVCLPPSHFGPPSK